MPLAATIERFLIRNRCPYAVLSRNQSGCIRKADLQAEANVAKAVLLSSGEEYAVVLIPEGSRLNVQAINEILNRNFRLAPLVDLKKIFFDCGGVVPAFGAAYGIRTLVDEALLQEPEVYLEAGADECSLLRLDTENFTKMLGNPISGRFSITERTAISSHAR